MITTLYSIYDHASGVYNRPFHALNDQVALRSATDVLSDPNTDIARHPEQFSLWAIGEYDDQRALIECFSNMHCVCRFHELQLQLDLKDTLPEVSIPDTDLEKAEQTLNGENK